MIKQVRFLEAGSCQQMEWFVNPKGRFQSIRFPSSVAVIEHATQGILLFDTGYSPRFNQVTRHFPEKLYALATPVQIEPEETALFQLKNLGISVNDVNHVVLSHFHADHVAGAADFTRAQYVFSADEYQFFRAKSRFGQVKSGFLNALLPTDLEHRMHVSSHSLMKPKALIPELGAGWYGTDLFGDESVMLVPLPGHTLGQTGLFIRVQNGESYFLVADAAWLRASYELNVMPFIVAQSIFHDRHQYAETLKRIHEVHQHDPNLKIVPCHCVETLEPMFTCGGTSV